MCTCQMPFKLVLVIFNEKYKILVVNLRHNFTFLCTSHVGTYLLVCVIFMVNLAIIKSDGCFHEHVQI